MTTKTEILTVIRSKCLDCCCYQTAEVWECRVSTCGLWPYRLGMDPEPSRTRGFAKSPVYTASFEESAPMPADTLGLLPDHRPTSPSRGLHEADPAHRGSGGPLRLRPDRQW